MEFFYPDNFVRVFNDEEKDEVGEYEILVNSPITPPIDPTSRIVAMSFCEPRSWTRVLSS